MNGAEFRLYRRLRISGSLIIAGLVVEALSLIRIHPLAFLAFMFIGGSLLIAGIVLFLYSIVEAPPSGNGDHAP
jgi:uncharacterized membrane protein YedE/YeeE